MTTAHSIHRRIMRRIRQERSVTMDNKTTFVRSSRPEAEVMLLKIEGDCLEGVGVPPRGCTAVIDRTITPVIGDLVWCRKVEGSISSYIKRVKSYEDDRLIVGTAYIDSRKDFEFFATSFNGVVMYVFDGDGYLVYRREKEESSAETTTSVE